MEHFPAWIAADHAKVPFGTYLRRRIRREIMGSEAREADALSDEYAFWANLG
jgi:hypothetical protein